MSCCKAAWLIILLLPGIIVLAGCGVGSDTAVPLEMTADSPKVISSSAFTPVPTETVFTAADIEFSSSAFSSGELMPPIYTCFGENLSVPLEWENPPDGVESFAIICDDPDAKPFPWVHWVLYNIPSQISSLPETAEQDADMPEVSIAGRNSWGSHHYVGPSPPSGTHRYYFRLYALDTMLEFETSPGKDELLVAMEGHVLGMGELMGTFTRPE